MVKGIYIVFKWYLYKYSFQEWCCVVLSSESKFVYVFLSFVYICIAVDDPVIKRGRVCSYLYCRWRSSHQEGAGDPINWFNCTTFLCLSKPRVWISNIICCFVDHHCLKLSFHNLQDIKISSIPSHNIKPLVYLFIVQDENYESTWIKQWKVR